MRIKKNLKEKTASTVGVVHKVVEVNLKYKTINTIDENNYKKVLKHYKFNDEDATFLASIQEEAGVYTKELLEKFYDFIFEFDHARMFLHNKEVLLRHEQGIKNWYLSLFSGLYDKSYFDKLQTISEIHVRIGLPAHYVNTAFSFVRGFVKDIIIKKKKYEVLSSWDKIIDINLDILTIAYREEEQTKLLDEIIFIKNVIENSSIEPYIQGIFDAKNLKEQKYECLMRLKNETTGEMVSVYPYLKTAKKIKLYEKMTYIMIDKSLKHFDSLDVEFSLNLSYEDISNKAFRVYLYEKLERFSRPKNIIFEILETDFIEDFQVVEDFALTIRDFGCKIAIDDFGSGYSSMENILKLNPEFIKIDASLIKNIDKQTESKTIVRNIVNMAKELDSKTIAEYIHSKKVYKIVKELGVDYLQGYYLAKPEPLYLK